MPKESLPIKLDPFRFADNAIRLHGVLPISQLQRLCLSLYKDEGEIDVNLTFGVDEEGLRYVRGHYDTNVVLQCQRCMEPFFYEVIGDFALGIVSGEKEAEQLPSRYDPAIVSDGMLNMPEVVEDELIVSLPLVPMHNPKQCQVKLPLVAGSDRQSESEKENPFKVIELLRSKRDPK